MNDYNRIPTSAEVCVVLMALHAEELRVYGSYINPEGEMIDGNRRAVIKTEYAFEDGRWPIIGIRTTWEVGDTTWPRKSEYNDYWLCVRTEAQDAA